MQPDTLQSLRSTIDRLRRDGESKDNRILELERQQETLLVHVRKLQQQLHDIPDDLPIDSSEVMSE